MGGMLAWEQVGFTDAFAVTFALNGASIAAGELMACYGPGRAADVQLPRIAFFRNRMGVICPVLYKIVWKKS